MPSKVQIYAQLAEDTGRQIMKDYENWTAFLRTSARLYKYPYLISGQARQHLHSERQSACCRKKYSGKSMQQSGIITVRIHWNAAKKGAE